MLELTKLQKIFIRQDANFGKISIFKKDENAIDEAPVAEIPAVEPAPIDSPQAQETPNEPGETDVQP